MSKEFKPLRACEIDPDTVRVNTGDHPKTPDLIIRRLKSGVVKVYVARKPTTVPGEPLAQGLLYHA